MDKISVVYWSGTGNTQEMAKAVAEGIKEAGADSELIEVGSASIDLIKGASKVALGCPSMGVEVLEESEMEPFVEKFEKIASGKTIALFGSYGWGDGEWMRNWVDRMNSAGANVLNNEGTICNESPDDAKKDECRALGKQLVSA